MASVRTHLAGFAALHTHADADERRRVARQGLATLGQISGREPAPLEGIAPAQLLLSVRAMLQDGVLSDLSWLSPAAAAVALFELAQALPTGAERRELGRRVLTQLREADRDTFVRLIIALARSSPKVVASEGLRARLEVVLSAPFTAPRDIGELAIGLLAQPALAANWVEVPATGSLPSRRLAGRILAHAAREALRRLDGGDRGGVQILARPGIRTALSRLLGDREALVWRFASIARGLLAHVDSDFAAEIDRELRVSASNSECRRGSASGAAALERGGAAERWAPMLATRAARQPGVTRGTILGLAGLAIVAPERADALALALVQCAPLEAAEAIAELRREEAAPLLAQAAAAAHEWTRAQIHSGPSSGDDGQLALLHALDAELREPLGPEGIAIPIAAARNALDVGDTSRAVREARTAVEELSAAADWLEKANDDDALDRRHTMRLLRELDRELFADNTLPAVLALAPDRDPVRTQYASALAAIEAALLGRETVPETGNVAQVEFRIARLRALVRLLDGVSTTQTATDLDPGPRFAAVRHLMTRAQVDQSPLRRAVWAALTRAGDALVRDGHAELTDFLLAWTMAFPDDDFAIVHEASMVPDIEAAFQAYARLREAAADPAESSDDMDRVRAVVERLSELADALPPEQSPRVESVRLALARLGNQLARLASVTTLASVDPRSLDDVATQVGTLARRTFGACQRLGIGAADTSDEIEVAIRSIETALHQVRNGADITSGIVNATSLSEPVAATIGVARTALPPALANVLDSAFTYLANLPSSEPAKAATQPVQVMLPNWVPLSRQLGSFYVVRPIGRGAGGSVFLAVRADERSRTDRELVALKVPDYSAEAARILSEREFERLFRQEAGALLALPAHAHLARFITFDASAEPKPILAMEFVRGENLERALENNDLTIDRALGIIDNVLSGLEAMHAVQIAHLDVKPLNVVLRTTTGDAVLVDFGLAGRRIRTGCGSVHYGAGEVWVEGGDAHEPFPADVYATACVAYEVLTGKVLFGGDSVKEVLDQHLVKQPAAAVLSRLQRTRSLAGLAELLRAALARDPRRRPTAARLRAGFQAVGPELRRIAWPIAA